MNIHCIRIVVSVVLCVVSCAFGQNPHNKTVAQDTATQLAVSKTTKASEMAMGFEMPLVCDLGNNVFLKTINDGISSIHKLNPDGERVATFTASLCPDIKIQIAAQFAVAHDGRVYQIVIPSDDPYRSVIVFNADGTCHSKVKLETPFSFIPYQIAVYPSGTMLIAGLRSSGGRDSKTMLPYTALFSASGSVLKAIELEDDGQLDRRATEGDPKVTSPTDPHGNTAIARGEMAAAADGNMYLMRRTSRPCSTLFLREERSFGALL
jgi:hypothetical protein